MGNDSCANLGHELAKEIFGDDLPFDKGVIDDITDRIRKRARTLKLKDNLPDSEAARKASEEIQREYDHLSDLRRRQARLDAVARGKWMTGVKQFASESRGHYVKVVGTEGKEFGVGDSINAQRAASLNRLYSAPDGMLTLLSKNNKLGEDLRPHLLNMNHQASIIDEMDGIETNDPRSKEVARIVRLNQEYQRKMINRFGGDVKPLEGRISTTIHDPYEIGKYHDSFFHNQLENSRLLAERVAAYTKDGQEGVEAVNEKYLKKAYTRWSRFIKPLLDLPRTFGDHASNAKELDEIMYNDFKSFVSQLHEHDADLARTTGIDSETGYTTRAMTANKINERHRFYHFKNGQDWMNYQMKFGRATLAQSLDHELHRSATDLAILQKLGPTGLRYLEGKVRQAALVEKTKSAKLHAFATKRVMNVLDGTANRVVNSRLAKISQNLRDFARIETLGFSTLHSFQDVANEIATLKYNGVGFGERWASAVKNFISFIPSAERRAVLDQMVVSTKSLIGSTASRYTPDQAFGGYSKLQSQYFNLNGQHPWDWERMGGISSALGRRMALNRNLSYANLDINFKKSLSDSAIGEREWDAIRQSAMPLADKKLYILADSVSHLNDDVIRNYIGNPKASARAIEKAKIDLEDLVTKHFFNAEQHVVPFPGLKEQAFASSGGPKGTLSGEATRFFTQFKNFPYSFVDRVVKREILGNPNRTPFSILGGLAELMVSTAIFTAIGNSAAELLKGETIPDYSKPENMKRLLAPAFGLYGDFLMNNYFSYGHSIMDFVKGPVISKFDQLASDVNLSKPGVSALKITRDLTPNLWFMHALFRNVLYNKFAEMLDPGSTDRAKNRLKDSTGQSIWI